MLFLSLKGVRADHRPGLHSRVSVGFCGCLTLSATVGLFVNVGFSCFLGKLLSWEFVDKNRLLFFYFADSDYLDSEKGEQKSCKVKTLVLNLKNKFIKILQI